MEAKTSITGASTRVRRIGDFIALGPRGRAALLLLGFLALGFGLGLGGGRRGRGGGTGFARRSSGGGLRRLLHARDLEARAHLREAVDGAGLRVELALLDQ